MLKRWRNHRERRFSIYGKRSTVRLIILFGIILALILFLEKLK